jgi:hypothetical protein
MKRITLILVVIIGSISFSQDLDSLNQRKIDIEYNNRIELGNSLFEAKEFSRAKEAYNWALSIKPSEPYPKGQIYLIQNSNSNCAVPNQYNKMLKKADEYFEMKDYVKSKGLYGRCIKLKPDKQNLHAKNQIIVIDKIVKNQFHIFNSLIKEGDDLFLVKKYFSAKVSYLKAYALDSSSTCTVNKIKNCHTNLYQDYSSSYIENIVIGDLRYSLGKFSEAQGFYSKALLSLEPSEIASYGMEMIEKCSDLVSNTENYYKLVNKADEYLKAKEYEKAKGLYLRSLGIETNKEKIYVNRMLKEIEIKEKALLPKEKRDIGDVEFYFIEIDNSSQAEYYQDSLQKEYDEWSFYFLNSNKEKEDGLVLIEDLGILYRRYSEEEIIIETEKQCQKVLRKADEYFESGNYSKALSLYERYMSLKPDGDHNYTKKQIKRCKKELK